MKQINNLIFGLLFGFSFPILFPLIALTLWFYSFQYLNVAYVGFSGLITGLLVFALFIKKLIINAFNLPAWILIGFYMFYNICVYGVFMGFPVFNLGMGYIAGYYIGIKINNKNFSLSQIENLKKRVPLFTSLIMLLICISTGLMALFEKTIGLELQGMLGLGFQVTRGMVISVILIGGLTLIVAQYYLTKITMTKTIKYRYSETA